MTFAAEPLSNPKTNSDSFFQKFNPMEIYRPRIGMSIISRILKQAAGFNEQPRSTNSYDPTWFVM